MIGKRISLLVLFYLFMTTNFLYAQDSSDTKNLIKKNEPIEIVSDRMEAFNEKKMVIFSGNAKATQGDITLKADQLLLFNKNEPGKKDKAVTKENDISGELDKIEARGNVIITQKERMATGDEAIYQQDSGQMILTGNAILREGKNIITGCKVIVYTNEDHGSVVPCTPGKNERVKAIIYPQQNKERKK
jgi:lipopolysaccharide export system protein LptA